MSTTSTAQALALRGAGIAEVTPARRIITVADIRPSNATAIETPQVQGEVKSGRNVPSARTFTIHAFAPPSDLARARGKLEKHAKSGRTPPQTSATMLALLPLIGETLSGTAKRDLTKIICSVMKSYPEDARELAALARHAILARSRGTTP